MAPKRTGAKRQRSPDATKRFCAALSRIPADLPALRSAVADGANVMVGMEETGEHYYDRAPTLSVLIHRGELEAVLACLESPNPIDFNDTGYFCDNPIYEIAKAITAGWPEYNRRVLSAVVDRIARNPGDAMDWEWERPGDYDRPVGLLSLAAKHQLLSVFWPVLKSGVTYFADQTEPMRLVDDVWAHDWAALGRKEQQCFNKKTAALFIDADEATRRLWVSCRRYPAPDYAAIEECVAAGADVMAECRGGETMLSYMFQFAPVEVAEALLRTPLGINFCDWDSHPRDHVVYSIVARQLKTAPMKTAEEVRRLLHLVLDRLAQHPEEDRVDWGEPCGYGHTPISTAARYGHLATFVEVMFHERPTKYFTDYPGRFKITCTADRSDVRRLRASDLWRFDFTIPLD